MVGVGVGGIVAFCEHFAAREAGVVLGGTVGGEGGSEGAEHVGVGSRGGVGEVGGCEDVDGVAFEVGDVINR